MVVRVQVDVARGAQVVWWKQKTPGGLEILIDLEARSHTRPHVGDRVHRAVESHHTMCSVSERLFTREIVLESIEPRQHSDVWSD